MNTTLLLVGAIGVLVVGLSVFLGNKIKWGAKGILSGGALTLLGFGSAWLERGYGQMVLWALVLLGLVVLAGSIFAWTKGRKQPWAMVWGALLGLIGFGALGWLPNGNQIAAQAGAVSNMVADNPASNAADKLAQDAVGAVTDAVNDAKDKLEPNTQNSETMQNGTAQDSTAQDSVTQNGVAQNDATQNGAQENLGQDNAAKDGVAQNNADQTVAPQNSETQSTETTATTESKSEPTTNGEAANTSAASASTSAASASTSADSSTTSTSNPNTGELREVNADCPCLVNIAVNAENPRITLMQNGAVVASSAAQISSLHLEKSGQYTLEVEAAGHHKFSQSVVVSKSLNLELNLKPN